MELDYDRLRRDQLIRLYEVGLDFDQLSKDELIDLYESQQEVSSLGAAFTRTGATVKQAGLGALASLMGREDIGEKAQQDYQRTMEELELRAPEREVPSIYDVYQDEGLFGAIGAFPTFAAESIIETVPPIVGVVGAGIAGTLVGGPRAGAAAGVAVGSALETAFNVAAQAEEQNIPLSEVDYQKAALFGTVQGSLELLPIAKFAKVVKSFGKVPAEKMLVDDIQRNPLLRRGQNALLFGAGGAALEGITEAAQESLSLIQSAPTVDEGWEIFSSLSEDVQRQLIDAGFAGAGVGGSIGSVTGLVRPTGAVTEADIARDLEALMAEENRESLNMTALATANQVPRKKAEDLQDSATDVQQQLSEALDQEKQPIDKQLLANTLEQIESDTTPITDVKVQPSAFEQAALETEGVVDPVFEPVSGEGDVNTALTQQLDALQIPSGAPIRKRLKGVNINTDEGFAQVQEELRKYAANPRSNETARARVREFIQAGDEAAAPLADMEAQVAASRQPAPDMDTEVTPQPEPEPTPQFEEPEVLTTEEIESAAPLETTPESLLPQALELAEQESAIEPLADPEIAQFDIVPETPSAAEQVATQAVAEAESLSDTEKLRDQKKNKLKNLVVLREDLSDARFMVFSKRGPDGMIFTLVDPETGLVVTHERVDDALYPYFRTVDEGGRLSDASFTSMLEKNYKDAIAKTKMDIRSGGVFEIGPKKSAKPGRGVIVPEALRERAREAYKKVPAAEYNAKIKEIVKALRKRLKQLGLDDVQLRTRNLIGNIEDGITEGISEINSKASKAIITLAVRLYDPTLSHIELEQKLGSVMNHEIIHALVDLGLLTQKEIDALARNAAKVRYVDGQGNRRLFSYLDRAKRLYPDKDASPELQKEEAIAEMFRAWAEGKLKVPGPQETFFRRIVNFFKQIFGAHQDNGITEMEQIFEEIESGSIGARERVFRDEGGEVVKEARRGPRIMPNGEIVGAPPGQRTEADRTNLLRRFFRYMEHPFSVADKSKDWYERSGQAIREISRGDPEMMDRVARLMALYSQANSVGANTTALIKSIYQLASGQDTAFAGRFPNKTAARIPDLLAAPVFDRSSVEGVSDKIENFYRNLIDPALGLDRFDEASTMDKWMMRLMGYKVADDEVKGGASALSKTQYAYARDIMRRLSDAWKRKTGERLKARQVQAILWTYIKNKQDYDVIKDPVKKEKFEPKVVDFGDYLTRATAHVLWEARPSESIDSLEWIHDSPREVQEIWNETVREILTDTNGNDKIMSLFPSDQLYNSTISTGAYEGKVTPNVISRIVLRKDDGAYVTDIANKYAAIMGYILKQDAVPWYRPDIRGGKLDSVGFDVAFDVDLTPELEQALFNHINSLIPDIGYTKVDGNLQFINFRDENGKPMSGISDKKFEERLLDALRSFPEEIDFGVDPFRAQSNYIFNDWKENRNGESYIETYGGAGFADIQETVNGWRDQIETAARDFDSRRDELLGYDGKDSGRADVRARGGKSFTGKQSRRGYPVYESGRLGPAKGRSSFDGYHYSGVDGIDFLTSSSYGTGKAGLELKRGWKPRVLFYLQQEAQRPTPEQALRKSKNGYGASLPNIYDPRKSRYIIDAIKEKNNGILNFDLFEDMVESEGYDGYIAWAFEGPSPAMVLLGENSVPVIQEMRNGEKANPEDTLTKPKQSRRGDFTPSATYAEIMNRVVAPSMQRSSLSKAWDRIFGRVGNETVGQAFNRNVINKYFPAFLLDQAAYGTLITDVDSVGRAMEVGEQLTGRLDALWNIGAFQYDRATSDITFVNAVDNKGLYKIFERIGTTQQVAFETYAIARRERDLRLHGRQGMTIMTDVDIDNIISESPAFFEEVFSDYQQFNKRMVQFAVDAGIIEPAKAQELVDMAYVPFYREVEADANDPMSQAEIIGPRATAALKNPRAFNIKLGGSTAPIGDLYENIARNTSAIMSASLRNIALQKTANALEILNAQGVTSWGRRANKMDKENVINVRYNGKSKSYKIEDASLWVSIAQMNPSQQHALIQIAAMIGGVLRAGITLFPGFMLANMVRGKVDGFVKTGVTLNPMTTINGFMDAYRDGESTMAIKSRTGIGGYTYGMGTKDFAASVKSRYRRGEMFNNPSLRSVSDALLGLKDGMERVGEATEFAERVALYEQLVRKGVSKREAAYKAMNLINFGRRGAGQGYLGQFFSGLIPMVPFLNARIQGLYRMFENEQAQGRPAFIPATEMLVRGAMITAASAAMYALGSDDERWENEPIYRKVNYDIFYLGEAGDPDAITIYIPRAFEVGSLFGAIPVLALDAIRQGSPRDLFAGTKEIFFNTLAFNPIPAAVRPSLEVLTNTNFFTGEDLESIGLQRMAPQDRFYESTPYIYRKLADLTRDNPFLPDFSPIQAKQIVEGHLGSLATAVVATSDVLFSGSMPDKPTGLFGDPYSPQSIAAQLTGLGRFAKADEAQTSRYVQEFYDLRRNIDEIHYSLKQASEAGDSERVNQLLEEKGTAYGYRSQVNRVGTQLQKINSQIRQITINPSLTSEQKAEFLAPLRQARNNLTKQMVQAAMQAGIY